MEFQGTELMTLGSPTSPKPGPGAQFLPGFLMGDLPAPVTPQPRSFGVMDMRSPLQTGGSTPQPVVPTHKDKSGAPPVRSIYDDLSSPAVGMSPMGAHKQPFSMMHTPLSGYMAVTPGTASSIFSPATIGQQAMSTMSPAQVDPFFTQGDALSSEDRLDDTWITVFGFPPAAASYILLQFAQYGNIMKHVMSNTGNWMHIQYQSKLQARKALSKDGKIFGEAIMIGVKPCIDKNVMESSDRGATSSGSVFTPPVSSDRGATSSGSVFTPPVSSDRGATFSGSVFTPPVSSDRGATFSGSVFTPPVSSDRGATFSGSVFTPPVRNGTPGHHVSTPRSSMRPLSAAYQASSSDYQVVADGQTPRKDDSLVSKAMEYMFGW